MLSDTHQATLALQEDMWNEVARVRGENVGICFHVDRSRSTVGRTLHVIECDYCEARVILTQGTVDYVMPPVIYRLETSNAAQG